MAPATTHAMGLMPDARGPVTPSEAHVAVLRHEIRRLRRQVETLEEALESRTVIGQATGVIMAATSRNPDEAFGLLVEESQHLNVKMRDLAARLVGNMNAGVPE